MEYYRQCVLKKNDNLHVCWIPKQFAKEGRYVKIKQDKKWVNGWKVHYVGNRIAEDILIVLERAHMKHRERTDI